MSARRSDLRHQELKVPDAVLPVAADLQASKTPGGARPGSSVG